MQYVLQWDPSYWILFKNSTIHIMRIFALFLLEMEMQELEVKLVPFQNSYPLLYRYYMLISKYYTEFIFQNIEIVID